MATIVTHYRGDTFSRPCTYVADDVPIDLTNYTIRCQLRTATGQKLSDLTVVKTGPTLGQFVIGATFTVCAAWPAGSHILDIEYTDAAGVRRSSSRFSLIVSEDVTR